MVVVGFVWVVSWQPVSLERPVAGECQVFGSEEVAVQLTSDWDGVVWGPGDGLGSRTGVSETGGVRLTWLMVRRPVITTG